MKNLHPHRDTCQDIHFCKCAGEEIDINILHTVLTKTQSLSLISPAWFVRYMYAFDRPCPCFRISHPQPDRCEKSLLATRAVLFPGPLTGRPSGVWTTTSSPRQQGETLM